MSNAAREAALVNSSTVNLTKFIGFFVCAVMLGVAVIWFLHIARNNALNRARDEEIRQCEEGKAGGSKQPRKKKKKSKPRVPGM